MLIIGSICFILFIISLVILEGIVYKCISFIDPKKFLISLSEKDENMYNFISKELSQDEKLFKFYCNIVFKLFNIFMIVPFILLILSFLFFIL